MQDRSKREEIRTPGIHLKFHLIVLSSGSISLAEIFKLKSNNLNLRDGNELLASYTIEACQLRRVKPPWSESFTVNNNQFKDYDYSFPKQAFLQCAQMCYAEFGLRALPTLFFVLDASCHPDCSMTGRCQTLTATNSLYSESVALYYNNNHVTPAKHYNFSRWPRRTNLHTWTDWNLLDLHNSPHSFRKDATSMTLLLASAPHPSGFLTRGPYLIP